MYTVICTRLNVAGWAPSQHHDTVESWASKGIFAIGNNLLTPVKYRKSTLPLLGACKTRKKIRPYLNLLAELYGKM